METALVTRADMAATMDVKQLQGLGEMLALSGYFEKSGDMKQQVAQMCTKILAGREMGMGPFAAVQGIYLIKGKLSFAANLIASAIKASGRYDYKVKRVDDTGCEIDFFEKRNGQWELSGTSTFNLKDAERAGTQNMKAYPRNMMFARCMSNGQKWYCPDVFNGNTVYVPEELGAEVDGDGNVVSVIEVKPTVVEKEALSTSGNGNGGGGDATTGIVKGTATPTVPEGTEPWRTWKNHSDALVWASEQGVYNAPEHAQNSYKLLAEELFPGVKHTSVEQKVQLFEAFYAKVQDKLEVKRLREAADNPFIEVEEDVNGRAVDVTDSTVAH
jgi:hypothetical protein